MQDYAERADELVARIDAGELDPEQVDVTYFVEHEDAVLTPELAERLPKAKIQEYNARAAERDHHDLRDEQREKQDDYDDALDKLRDPGDAETATVTLGETELTVKTYLSGDVERKFERLQNERTNPDVQRELIPEVLAWVVEAPEEYADAELWRAYAEEFGRDELSLALMQVLEPKLERAEDAEVIRKFRDRFGGEAPPSGQ